jgi:hypothetical protein
MTFRHRLAVLTLILGSVLVVSCDKSSGPIVRGPSDATPFRLEIVAPPSIEPGASVQLRANVVRTGGAVENVTDQVQWSSTDTRVLQVTAAGMATGVERGEVHVRVIYQQARTTSVPLMVVPTGTFRLGGRVTENGFPVPGVTLTVVDGVGQGLTAATNGNGTYLMYGVAGQVRMVATKPGYQDRIETVAVGEHRSLDIEMVFSGRRLDLSGTYALSVEVSGCDGKLPEGARHRAYEAIVQQNGQQLSVRLRGGDFIVVENRGDRFKGSIRPDDLVVFQIGEDFFTYYYYYTTPNPAFVERLTDTDSLVVIGTVTAKGSPAAISGTLMGTIGLVARTGPPFWPFSVLCHSDEHRFEMRRK